MLAPHDEGDFAGWLIASRQVAAALRKEMETAAAALIPLARRRPIVLYEPRLLSGSHERRRASSALTGVYIGAHADVPKQKQGGCYATQGVRVEHSRDGICRAYVCTEQ